MSVYLDTSVLVTALVAEAATPATQVWLARQARGTLLASAWTIAETASALGIKHRQGAIDTSYRTRALAALWHLVDTSIAIAPISERHFETAVQYVSAPNVVLRAADALHLAIAADSGATLATRDHRMADAAQLLGFDVERL